MFLDCVTAWGQTWTKQGATREAFGKLRTALHQANQKDTGKREESTTACSSLFLVLIAFRFLLIPAISGLVCGMDHDETGCQAPPEGPLLCINNCSFFGSVATMNMCSKCYKDAILKEEQTKLAASSIENIVNGSSSGNGKDPIVAGSWDIQVDLVEPKVIAGVEACGSGLVVGGEVKAKQGPNRCAACKKRVGLTGFNCRCGDLFCSVHRYSDKHNCPFDYRTAGREAISKANPVVKAEKLEKI